MPGNVTGPVVYALTLYHPSGTDKGTQILRVLGASESECVGLMSQAIGKELFTQWHVNQMVDFDREQFQTMHAGLSRLAAYLQATYSDVRRGMYRGYGASSIAIAKLELERRRWWHIFKPRKPLPTGEQQQ